MRMNRKRSFVLKQHSRIVSKFNKPSCDLTDSDPVTFSQGFLFGKLCKFEFKLKAF